MNANQHNMIENMNMRNEEIQIRREHIWTGVCLFAGGMSVGMLTVAVMLWIRLG